MYIFIEKYMNNFSIDKLDALAIKKDIVLSEDELKFTYNFIKKNWSTILSNPNIFNINKYEVMYSEDNFKKIKKLYTESMSKYFHLLK